MNVIVGKLDNKMRKFLIDQKFSSGALVIDKMCNVKYLTDPISLYIPFDKINKVGLVENTFVHIEEFVITANIKRIYYGNQLNESVLMRISQIYNIELQYINIK